jgi:hemerythrin-like domain-containing protein
MSLFDALADEHRLIDNFAGSLVRCAGLLERGEADGDDLRSFVAALRGFVGGFHHRREEEIVFAVLVEHAEVPAHRGPIPILIDEHREAAALVDELERSAGWVDEAAAVARRLAAHLWEHVDKETSVIFPEAMRRLVRGGISTLEDPPPTPDEEAARGLAEELVARFPPEEDREVMRGDGCIACSHFAVTCGGIEKEWWNDWEIAHYRTLDEG